jgi:hypothetical protein
VVARLLPFVRRSRRRFPCHAADATLWIRFEGLESALVAAAADVEATDAFIGQTRLFSGECSSRAVLSLSCDGKAQAPSANRMYFPDVPALLCPEATSLFDESEYVVQ